MSCHVLEVKAIETYLRHVCTANDRGGSGGNLIREKMLLKKKSRNLLGTKPEIAEEARVALPYLISLPDCESQN